MRDDLRQGEYTLTKTAEVISTSKERDLNYWSHEFGVNRLQLLDAVNTVGNSAQAVREHLGKGSQ